MILETGHPYSPLVATYIAHDQIEFMNAILLARLPHVLQDKLCDYARTLDYRSFRKKVRDFRNRYYAKRQLEVRCVIMSAFDAEQSWVGARATVAEQAEDEARINAGKEIVSDYLRELETL